MLGEVLSEYFGFTLPIVISPVLSTHYSSVITQEMCDKLSASTLSQP